MKEKIFAQLVIFMNDLPSFFLISQGLHLFFWCIPVNSYAILCSIVMSPEYNPETTISWTKPASTGSNIIAVRFAWANNCSNSFSLFLGTVTEENLVSNDF